MAGNPTLTKILFAGLIITFVVTILLSNYSTFVIMNNASIEEPYKSIFGNISSKYSEFSEVGGVVKNKGLVTNILNFGSSITTGTLNIFVTGLQAMGTFFNMIPIYGDILSAISFGLPALAGLMSLLLLIVGVYIAMKYIQTVSNKNELP
jgi:hypothetical protein